MTSHIGPDDWPVHRPHLHDELRAQVDALSKPETELSKEITNSDPVPLNLIQAVSDRSKYPFVAPAPDKLQGYIDAAILVSPVDPEATVVYGTQDVKIEDLPSADLRASLGYGHYGPFSRPVIQRTDGKDWLYTPNMCLIAANYRGVWVDPQHLACPGCGLDIT